MGLPEPDVAPVSAPNSPKPQPFTSDTIGASLVSSRCGDEGRTPGSEQRRIRLSQGAIGRSHRVYHGSGRPLPRRRDRRLRRRRDNPSLSPSRPRAVEILLVRWRWNTHRDDCSPSRSDGHRWRNHQLVGTGRTAASRLISGVPGPPSRIRGPYGKGWTPPRRGAAPPEDRRHRMADACGPRCLSFPLATWRRHRSLGPPVFAVDTSRPAPRSGGLITRDCLPHSGFGTHRTRGRIGSEVAGSLSTSSPLAPSWVRFGNGTGRRD